jgi:CRP-like cAMP-binding protein
MASYLRQIPVFREIPEEELRVFESTFEKVICPEGIIFEQGDPAKYLYLVLRGTVEIRYKPYDGPPLTITRVKVGGVFGWSAIAGNAGYTSGALCRDACEVIRVEGKKLRELCAQHADIGGAFLDYLADSVSNRWKDAHAQVRAILRQGITNTPPAESA